MLNELLFYVDCCHLLLSFHADLGKNEMKIIIMKQPNP